MRLPRVRFRIGWLIAQVATGRAPRPDPRDPEDVL
jgi:hypothetical protein